MTDSFEIKTPLGSVGTSSSQIKVKEGDKLIVRYWSWRKFGFIRKMLIVKNGSVEVIQVD